MVLRLRVRLVYMFQFRPRRAYLRSSRALHANSQTTIMQCRIRKKHADVKQHGQRVIARVQPPAVRCSFTARNGCSDNRRPRRWRCSRTRSGRVSCRSPLVGDDGDHAVADDAEDDVAAVDPEELAVQGGRPASDVCHFSRNGTSEDAISTQSCIQPATKRAVGKCSCICFSQGGEPQPPTFSSQVVAKPRDFASASLIVTSDA